MFIFGAPLVTPSIEGEKQFDLLKIMLEQTEGLFTIWIV
jgi:hypothetical protein